MEYLWQHLAYILAAYDGRLPLHHFLKSYFARHKKLGSRDRRAITQAIYSWYRVGKTFADNVDLSEKVKIQAAMYLCGEIPKVLLTGDTPRHWEKDPGSPASRYRALKEGGVKPDLPAIFPFRVEMSLGINHGEWIISMFNQPRLFLRIRKDASEVKDILKKADLAYEWITETCLALPNGTKVEALLPDDSYVVQDASSQATGAYLQAAEKEQWWDCCAGAGGKSLMLLDAAPSVHLTASDIRPRILQNLKERVHRYGHSLPQTLVLDAADERGISRLGARRFDGIICDVPCSGSGTWARTPEGCYFFEPQILERYISRQKAILRNAATFLKEEGRLFYITCSVFRAENEGVLEEVVPQVGLRIVASQLINGVESGARADSLFVAELRRASA